VDGEIEGLTIIIIIFLAIQIAKYQRRNSEQKTTVYSKAAVVILCLYVFFHTE